MLMNKGLALVKPNAGLRHNRFPEEAALKSQRMGIGANVFCVVAGDSPAGVALGVLIPIRMLASRFIAIAQSAIAREGEPGSFARKSAGSG